MYYRALCTSTDINPATFVEHYEAMGLDTGNLIQSIHAETGFIKLMVEWTERLNDANE
jgi:hypothetical protein